MKTLILIFLSILSSYCMLAQCSPGATIRVGTSCACNTCSSVSVMSLESYVGTGLDDEWIPSWNTESLKAGAVAYRSYGAYYIVHPYSGSYDLANTTCKQVWSSSSSTSCMTAASATAGQVLTDGPGGPISRSEYAAETNNFCCGDGWSGGTTGSCSSTPWPCIVDNLCTGAASSGHWRGMCQWGSQRWAVFGQPYTWILDHYYNPANVFRCSGTPGCSPVTGNDFCFGPPAPQVLTVGSSCSYVSGTTCSATASITTGSSCSTSGLNSNTRDVWYSFVATGPTQNISVQSGANFDAVVEVYTSACGTLVPSCVDATNTGGLESVSLTGVTAGTTYFIRVYDYWENAYSGLSGGSNFNICVYYSCTLPAVVSVSGGGTFCGSAILTASGGSGGTIYWQNTTSGGTSLSTPFSSQVVTSSGTYYFRSYNSCGWGPEGSAIVTISSIPTAVTVSGGGTSCGSATLTASGGSGGTIYWQNSISGGTSLSTPSASQTVTSSGTYYFRAYSSCGWGPQGSATVIINAAPAAVTVSGGGTFCGGSATITAAGGSGGTIYWQNTTSGGTLLSTPSTSQVVTSSGTYYFRAYNSCGWGAEGSVTVTISSLPGAVSVSGGGAFCGSASITASGGAGGTIYWQNSTSGGTSLSTPSTSQIVSSSGTYYFRANNSCGWGPEGNATVTINTVPAAVTVSGGGTFCGGSASITAAGGSGGTIYWQNTTSGGTSLSTPSTSQVVTSSGTYYFRAYNSCGWGAEGSVTVTISSLPGAVSVSGGGAFCGSASITASGGAGGTIYWQNSTSGGTSLSTPSTSQVVSSSGTYYFRANNSCGWGPEGSVSVTISATPSFVTVSGGGAVCGASATLTASGGTGGTIYWQGTTSSGTSVFTPSTVQAVTSSGTYYFRSYNGTCWGSEGSATVAISPIPDTVIVSGGGTFCGSATLTASGGLGGTIYYQGVISGGTSTLTSSTSETVTSSGTYYFRSYNGSCWGAEGSVTVTVNPMPGSVTVSGSGTYCGSATLTATGGSGATIYWQNTTSGGTITTTPSVSQVVTSSGTYYFRASNSCGWSAEGSASVTINSIPASVTVSGGGSICGTGATLSAGGGAGGTIYWQNTTSGGISTSTPSVSQTVTSSGTYYFRSYDGNCWGAEGSAAVTINPVPAPVILSGGGAYCGTATITASAGSGGTIYWQGTIAGGTSTLTPSTSQTVTSSGTYYFRSFSGSCWGTEGSVTVTINPTPASVAVSGGGTFCGNSVTLTASGGAGGTVYWQNTTSGGTSVLTPSASQPVTSSGTYYFRAYNGACWGVEGNAAVVLNPLPVADFTASQTIGDCPFFVDFVDLSVTTGTTSWLWTIYNGSPGSPDTSTLQNPSGILFNAAGNYLVKLSVADICGTNTKIAPGYITVTGPCGVGVEEVMKGLNFDIRPNPTRGEFIVEGNFDIKAIEVTNVIGERVHYMIDKLNRNQWLVDLSGEAAGMYFISVEAESQSIKRKMVKF